MTAGQIFLTLIILGILFQTAISFHKKKFAKSFKIFWILIWIIALVIVLWPNLLSGIAEALGIGRGADVVIYFAIIFNLFAVFKVYAKNIELEQNITKLTRKIAILDLEKKNT